jgi:hypothetical protein
VTTPLRPLAVRLWPHLAIPSPFKLALPPLMTGYDAVDFYSVPGQPLLLMGYVDVFDEATGLSIYESMRRRWPSAIVIPITVAGTHQLTYDGRRVRVCDFEYRDLTAAGAAQWAAEELELGAPAWDPPTIYCQAANGLAAFQALAAIDLRMGVDVPWMMAWWNGRPDLLIPPPPWPKLPMPVAHQYLCEYNEFDIFCALPEWATPSPPPPPKPKPKGGHVLFETNGTIYDGGLALDAAGKVVPCTATYTPNMKTAYDNAVAAGNAPPPVADYLNAFYNYYVVGNFKDTAQVSDLPGEDQSGLSGAPVVPSPPEPAS